MKYADQRAHTIALLREWAAEQLAAGSTVAEVHRKLVASTDCVLQEFRVQHDVPGTSYWLDGEAYFATMPGEMPTRFSARPMPLTRIEFIARQGIINYDEDRL